MATNCSPYDFTSQPSYDLPLVPPVSQWPAFDTAVMSMLSIPSPTSSYESSPSPSTETGPLPVLNSYPAAFPTSAALAAMPIPPSRGTSRNKDPDHVPRPRNAFMLFRSAFAAAQKISTNVEHDNRHITRIIAHCWNRLSETDKQVWRDKAAAEKATHAEKYPNYRFTPMGRTNKPVRRNVRRNGAEDKKRCEKVAELLLAGKHGKELESAVKEIDIELSVPVERVVPSDSGSEEPSAAFGWSPAPGKLEDRDVAPFRSPLLPPVQTNDLIFQDIHDRSFMLPRIATPRLFHPQPFYYPSDTPSDAVLPGYWDTQFYQPHMRDGVPSPRSISPPGNYQPIMDFMRNDNVGAEPLTPDFSSFSWNQTENYRTTSFSSSHFH